MKITIEPTTDQSNWPAKHCCISVTHPSDDLCMFEVIEDLIRPALLAWGFHPKTVAEHLDPDHIGEDASEADAY